MIFIRDKKNRKNVYHSVLMITIRRIATTLKMKQIFVSLVLLVVYSLAQSSDGPVCKNYNPDGCACELTDGSGAIDLTELAEQTAKTP